MNTSVENSGVGTETFRNNWLFIAVVFIASVIGFLVAPCLGILSLTALFPLHDYTFNRVVAMLGYLVGAYFSWMSGVAMWGSAMGMAHNHAILDAEGIHFRIMPDGVRGGGEQTVAWDQIAAIQHRRIANSQVYYVVAKDNRTVKFDSFSFFRPKKLARNIGARCGLPIQELK
jgi:hypothetical protein